MPNHPRAGQAPEPSDLVDVPALVAAYYTDPPDPSVPEHRISFGTSGHRGSSLDRSFNEPHILATTEAICRLRARRGITGPLYLGRDTHALSEPAARTALEVLAAHEVEVRVDDADGPTPTPAVSHAIVSHNRGRSEGLADGIVVTPSHNPPTDGGFKYNPPSGGPADSDTTKEIADEANRLLADGLAGVKRIPLERARRAPTTRPHDYLGSYVGELGQVVDVEAIRESGLRIGVDALGGAALAYWGRIAETHGLGLDVIHAEVDPTFRFVPLDWDGKIRMDCSSPHAMAGLVALRDRYDLALSNDTDTDRHGIVTPSAGLMSPNHYLAVSIDYLFRNRPDWPATAAIGKTLVSSALIDRVGRELDRSVVEVPVGFKWFVDGLLAGELGFGGEESAGACFLRHDGTTWCTDKDGIILGLLAAEMTATTGQDPSQRFAELVGRLGEPSYERIDSPATRAQKEVLKSIRADQVTRTTLAEEPVEAVLTEAPGNGASIGGVKVVSEGGWFAARPSGTEEIYKIYAESFRGPDHLKQIQDDARELVDELVASDG